MTGVLIRRGSWDTEKQGEDGFYKPRREASEGTNTAHTLILTRNQPCLHLQLGLPELGDNTFLSFQPLSLWHSVSGARMNSVPGDSEMPPHLPVGSFPEPFMWSWRRHPLALLPHNRKEAETTTPTASGGLLFLVKGPLQTLDPPAIKQSPG